MHWKIFSASQPRSCAFDAVIAELSEFLRLIGGAVVAWPIAESAQAIKSSGQLVELLAPGTAGDYVTFL